MVNDGVFDKYLWITNDFTLRTNVVNIYSTLSVYTSKRTVFSPWTNMDRLKKEYGIDGVGFYIKIKKYDVIILSVSHNQFADAD